MLILIVLGLPPFNLSFSVASALAFGAFAGFVVAAINWFRMKRRWKGAFHLLISPVIHLTFLFGIPLLVGLTIRLLSDGSTERAIEISQGISSEFVFALYFAAAFLVIAYLYSMTKRDITRLQAKDIATKYAGSMLAVGIAALSVLIMWGISLLATHAYVASVQNHVYCELLKPGMTQEEVATALKEIGPLYQVSTPDWGPRYKRENGGEYRSIFWKESDVEIRYDL